MTRIKICGITNVEDAFAALKAGADALGFVFYKKSPRYISPSKAKRIIEALPPFIGKVGVFVNERAGALRDIIGFAGIDTVQLHGEEDPHECHRLRRYGVKLIKAFRVQSPVDAGMLGAYHVDAYLFDTFSREAHGGTGETFCWDLLKTSKARRPVILSGGLKADNVAQAIEVVKPFAVDVSSGVETAPGKKDPALMTLFCQKVRGGLVL